MTFYSQDKQDEFLHNNVFKGHTSGYFVDVGAHDGKTINNTLFFEETLNWTGINIEPIKDVYDNIVKNRPSCANLNVAIDTIDYGKQKFFLNKGYTEMISGLVNYYDPRHYDRLNRENAYFKSNTQIIDVETRTLASIFKQYDVNHINYLSIDVEGAEQAVINSIDFENVFIDVIGFENNYNDNSISIIDYLHSKDYEIIHSALDIIMIHNKSKFK